MKLTISKMISYLGGIFLIAIGVNLSKMAGLGISPVASVPYAVELIWGIELGAATALVYVFLILFQMALLRQLRAALFLQLLTTVIMSGFTTVTSAENLLKWLSVPEGYGCSMVLLLVSILVIGIGVYFYVRPNYIPLPSEGIAKALVEVFRGKLQFPDAKVAVDCSLVLLAVSLGLVMQGRIAGVREGTVITAVLVGKVVGICRKLENHWKGKRQRV